MPVLIRRFEERDEVSGLDWGDEPLKRASRGFPNEIRPRLPRYDLPLILLARLAVDRRFAGRGIGHALISEAFHVS
jgi:GNAT superfamily N-acetyltransferase